MVQTICYGLWRRDGSTQGRLLLCLIPGNNSHADALRLELDINPFDRLLANALSPVEKAFISYNCMNLLRVKQIRRRVIKDLDVHSASQRPPLTQLSESLPELAPARKLHIPLNRYLVKELDYSDKSLPGDLVHGMPIVGEIPSTSTLPVMETPAVVSLHDVLGGVRTANEKVLKSVQNQQLQR